MSPLTAKVIGVERVELSIKTKREAVRREVWATIERLGFRLEGTVRAVWLSGRALHRRTGRLAGSVNAKFTATETMAVSRIGTNLPYGRFWELGFHGIEHVRAHTRRVRTRDVVAVGRRRKPMALGFAYMRPFSRRVNQRPRPFLKPALDEMRGTIRDQVAAAVRRGVEA